MGRQLIVVFTDGATTTFDGLLTCEIPGENNRVISAVLEGEGKPLVVILPLSAIKYAAYGETNE